MLLFCGTTEKQKSCYRTHWINAGLAGLMPKNKVKKTKIAFWTGNFGASMAGTWGAEDFIAVETSTISGCQQSACLMTVCDINPLKTAVNNGLFSADKMFCARKSRLPEASG